MVIRLFVIVHYNISYILKVINLQLHVVMCHLEHFLQLLTTFEN